MCEGLIKGQIEHNRGEKGHWYVILEVSSLGHFYGVDFGKENV